MIITIGDLAAAATVTNPQVNKEALGLIAAAKEEHVGIIRARMNDQLSSTFPGTSITVEQFNSALIAYVNKLAGGTLIQPLFSNAGPQIANLDENGMIQISDLPFSMEAAEGFVSLSLSADSTHWRRQNHILLAICLVRQRPSQHAQLSATFASMQFKV